MGGGGSVKNPVTLYMWTGSTLVSSQTGTSSNPNNPHITRSSISPPLLHIENITLYFTRGLRTEHLLSYKKQLTGKVMYSKHVPTEPNQASVNGWVTSVKLNIWSNWSSVKLFQLPVSNGRESVYSDLAVMSSSFSFMILTKFPEPNIFFFFHNVTARWCSTDEVNKASAVSCTL